MRVLVAGSYDPACQGYLTAKAMRDYLGWDARSLCTTQTWLDYDYDWLLGENVTEDEISEFAKDCDYFIFEDNMLPLLRHFVTPNNSCIAAGGTPIRNNMDSILMKQIKYGLKVIVPPQEPWMTNGLLSVPFDWVICPIDEILSLTRRVKRYDEFTVCHSPTSFNKKGSEQIIKALEESECEYKVITKVPWRDAIREKAKCHANIDSMTLGTYGLNVLEAFVLNQAAITYLLPWCYMIYPDLPVMNVDKKLKCLGTALSVASTHNVESLEWVKAHNSAEVVSERWVHYMDWVLG